MGAAFGVMCKVCLFSGDGRKPPKRVFEGSFALKRQQNTKQERETQEHLLAGVQHCQAGLGSLPPSDSQDVCAKVVLTPGLGGVQGWCFTTSSPLMS